MGAFRSERSENGWKRRDSEDSTKSRYSRGGTGPRTRGSFWPPSGQHTSSTSKIRRVPDKLTAMKASSLGIIMNGVTGRMGTNQHLVRSILAIREQGGTLLADGRRVMPEPVLVGRDRDKLEALARSHGLSRYTTNLDEALDDAANTVYFD